MKNVKKLSPHKIRKLCEVTIKDNELKHILNRTEASVSCIEDKSIILYRLTNRRLLITKRYRPVYGQRYNFT